jgi:uncharacterized membrane protein YdjX (TVP38/TMEM64 family)
VKNSDDKALADDDEPRRGRLLPLAGLLALVCAGALLHALDVLDWRETLQWARGHAQSWWLVAVLIAAQVVLFMFALPGSTVLLLVAPLYPPAVAAAILAAGGSLGGLAGYFFARRMTARELARLRRKRLFLLLQKHADFPALLALRLLPAFPHSVINYGAGVLRLPIAAFLAAAVLGLGVKSFLYASVIYPAAQAEFSELARIDTVVALLGLALLVFVGRAFRRRA